MPAHPSSDLVAVLPGAAEGVVVLARSELRAESAADLIRAWERAIDAAAVLGEPRRGVILDVRRAPSRNDDAFEDALPALHERMERCFPIVVTLVSTSVGVLQAKRLASKWGISDRVTHEMAEAVALCCAS